MCNVCVLVDLISHEGIASYKHACVYKMRQQSLKHSDQLDEKYW